MDGAQQGIQDIHEWVEDDVSASDPVPSNLLRILTWNPIRSYRICHFIRMRSFTSFGTGSDREEFDFVYV